MYKRVHRVDGDDKGVKKVFVSLTIGPYIIKKRLEKNGCQKYKHYLPIVATREQFDSDAENDCYELDIDTIPGVEDHRCGNTGEKLKVRSSFSQNLTDSGA